MRRTPLGLSIRRLGDNAAHHHETWVMSGIALMAVGYGIAATVTLTATPHPFPDVWSEIGAAAAGLVAFVAGSRGHLRAAALGTLVAVWLELHFGLFEAGTIRATGTTVLPVFVVGAGLFAGGRAALLTAVATIVSAPTAALLGTWSRSGHAALPNGETPSIITLAISLLVLGVLTRMALRSFGTVLAEARASGRRFADLFAQVPDGIVALDPEGRVEALNPAAGRLLRTDITGSLHRPIHEFVPLPPSGKPGESWPITLTDADAAARRVEASLHPLHHSEGADGTLLVLRDVTDRSLAAEREERFHRELEKAQRLEALGRLAAGLAHDFNNVLHAQLGHVEMAADSLPETHPAVANLREIEAAASRAGRLVNQLLTFGRRQSVDRRVVDVDALIAGLQALLTPLLSHGVALIRERAPGPHRVVANPDQLEQVIMNMVVNARDAMNGHGRLTIGTRTDPEPDPALGLAPGSAVVIEIADTGSGVPPDVIEHIFEPFFSTKSSGKGFGLGLATCYSIVHQSGGNIVVHSRIGEGTTFAVYLPACGNGDPSA